MSTPAGHSDAQALHDRHRSSDSSTSGDRQPATRDPFASSCRILARPRVESFSSLVARYEGHMTPGTEVARHFPTPVHRCTASVKFPPSS